MRSSRARPLDVRGGLVAARELEPEVEQAVRVELRIAHDLRVGQGPKRPATLGLVGAGWRLPGLMAATPYLVESLRTNADGRVYCVDTKTGQARYGRNGLMSAEERALELASDPEFAGPYITHT